MQHASSLSLYSDAVVVPRVLRDTITIRTQPYEYEYSNVLALPGAKPMLGGRRRAIIWASENQYRPGTACSIAGTHAIQPVSADETARPGLFSASNILKLREAVPCRLLNVAIVKALQGREVNGVISSLH
eukprot:6204665-Pleurochrysis_carterae.AAC.1